ncbi:MSF1 domain protein [Sporothrix brasiliensis 5110]|uniref:MSF1 domain protein n=1 Tax=Sporothrix brasiliensis 5110 TaxID=1398154 RepID=A0A0C2INR4_9PEZI|nr:MSF1 domain protein [Sporothrix brasiliensis 5110]KIH86687.1 MSF1 domain protein [Sporothrix brasiliensis 5110]
MVLTHTTNHTYSHPFPTVTLAFFLRYCSPQLNPFAQHVLSTDTISSQVDPETGRLHTTRIHLKKSRLPKAVLRLLPTSITGGMADKASYILETSVVDMRQGWMRTESRNLNFTGVLSVVEKQLYVSAPPEQLSLSPAPPLSQDQQLLAANSTTGVETTVVFKSRLGERIRERIEQGQQRYQQQIEGFKQKRQQSEAEQTGWFSSGWISGLGTKGIQRSIETIASTKTQDQLGKSREGMSIILERLRQTGIIGVLELRRRAMEGKLDAIEVA